MTRIHLLVAAWLLSVDAAIYVCAHLDAVCSAVAR